MYLIVHPSSGILDTTPIEINLPNREVKRAFTKHIAGMHNVSYEERLDHLNLYSIQSGRDRY